MSRLFYFGFMAILLSCAAPQIQLDKDLRRQATPMPVSGRQGWLMNQQIKFGLYHTDKLQRGWIKSFRNDAFLARLTGAQEKYSFTLFDREQAAYTITAANSIRGAELPLIRYMDENSSPRLREIATLSIHCQKLFAATLYHPQRQESWNLTLMSNSDIHKNGRFAGFLVHEQEAEIEILPIYLLERSRTIGTDILGYEFRQRGKPLAAVEVVNQGKVWIASSLDARLQQVLASASAALLLQQELNIPAAYE